MYQPQEQVKYTASRLSRSLLLQRHPVLVPLILLGGSFLFGLAAFVFPLLISGLVAGFVTLCLSLACVMGIAGLLAGLTTILEVVDEQNRKLQCRSSLLATMLSRLKEERYANRN